jgi:two-component system, OmpR family, heavy metal sensor histidine kinase CusS
MKSLESRLLVWTVGGMAVLLAAFGVAVYVLTRNLVINEFDESLQTRTQTLAAVVRLEKDRVSLDMGDAEMPEFNHPHRPAYFELWDDDAVIRRSASLDGRDLEPREAGSGKPRYYPVILPDGQPGRMAVWIFEPRTDLDGEPPPAPARSRTPPPPPLHPVVLAVARETHGIDAHLTALMWLLIGCGGASVLLTLCLAWLTVRQGLKPLGTMAGQIAAIHEDDLSARLAADDLPAEMAPVAARLNELLQRLDEAFRRERALTADVSHELRTPLAGMQSTLEVALSRARTSGDYQEALRECLEIVQQTEGMTENLLALARLEGDQVHLRPEPVRLAERVESLWRSHAAQVRARGLTMECRLSPDLAASADREILTLALSNLLANAAEYADGGGRIEVSGQACGDTVELVFSNTGCMLSADDAAHVFDRFWRGDASRTGTGVHCGLGLSLVQRAARALGGSVAATVEDGRFVVRLTVPAAR